uniref:Uncharacterized protein n=1 Tax=Mesocestoides corti TaxID=53468 RepID=A0A5K3FHK9_MESCO
MKMASTIEQALLTSHKSELHVRRRPFESTTLAAPIILYRFSCVSVWLSAYPPRMPLERKTDRGLAVLHGPVCLRPNTSFHVQQFIKFGLLVHPSFYSLLICSRL